MDWVVVVDDDILNLKMAGHILSKHNMRVTALKSGTALIEFIKTNKPDLILLDIKMPGMDGFETKHCSVCRSRLLCRSRFPLSS